LSVDETVDHNIVCILLHNLAEFLKATFEPSIRILFNALAPTDIYTLSLHDALPIWRRPRLRQSAKHGKRRSEKSIFSARDHSERSEEHTSELQSPYDVVCRLRLEKKNNSRAPCTPQPRACAARYRD